MSRRTERPYKVDGAGELARHSAARHSAPEINGPVVQREFTFLLREACRPSLSATVGAVASNGYRAGTGVSRGRSTEGNVPERPDGLTTREGLNLAGSHDHRWSCAGAMKPMAELPDSDPRGRDRVLLRPSGLPGTAGRGPACPVVWELGGATLPATRLGPFIVQFSPKSRQEVRCNNVDKSERSPAVHHAGKKEPSRYYH
jgi:hypothetical protein